MVIVSEFNDEVLSSVSTVLQSSPLLKSLKADNIKKVAKAVRLLEFGDGETVVEADQPFDSFYMVAKGEVGVMASGTTTPREICRFRAPETFGEVGLLLESPRSATVKAVAGAQLLQFDAAVFARLYEAVPGFGIAISRSLALRLGDTSKLIKHPKFGADAKVPQGAVVGLVPLPFVQRHRVLPLENDENQLTVGFVDAVTDSVIGALQKLLPGMDVVPVSIHASLFNRAMQSVSGLNEAPPPMAVAPPVSGGISPPPKVAAPMSVSVAPPVAPKKLGQLLRRMVEEGASDLHMSATLKPRWRIDGEIKEIADASPLGINEVFDLFKPIMRQESIEAFEEINDCDFAYSIPGVSRYRVNLFRDRLGVGAVLRQIASTILTVEQLGLPEIVTKICDYPKGLVLVTGPTGSGKSTTLAAMIDYINKTRKTHILTLEDPVEFVHQSRESLINQREIGVHSQSFTRALKAALREDPDIVLVGEMRDLETVSMALETANTGHLVFGTLHTSTAISTIDRIIGLFPVGEQAQVRTALSESLKGVVAQALCKKAKGGRVAALEILVSTPAVANLIREGKVHQIANAMVSGAAQGNQFLNVELAKLVHQGVVAPAEAMDKALDKGELAKRLGGKAWVSA
ncbi:MAG: PilT/PilU family type 4a pilus ATPase [Myxococcota bacterium]|nr:PilT/PilU family type 4a pilus ATPase [Myxococcota bacterium]